MKFTGTFKRLKIDRARFLKELDNELRELLAKSAFEWLNAATSVIPVWSGAALSTFRPLAETISFQLAIAPKPHAPDRRLRGESQSSGDLDIEPTKGRYFFKYSTQLEHLIYNEFNGNPAGDPNVFAPDRITNTPYGFQDIARAAWQKIADEAKLPAPRLKSAGTIKVG
jgi:hypothetical protein